MHPKTTAVSSAAGGAATSFAIGSRGRQSWTSTLSNPKNMLQRIFKQQFTAKSCMELQKSWHNYFSSFLCVYNWKR